MVKMQKSNVFRHTARPSSSRFQNFDFCIFTNLLTVATLYACVLEEVGKKNRDSPAFASPGR
jgi:hypothetical protein